MKIQNALVCHECSQVSHYDSDDCLSTAMPSDIGIEIESVPSGNEGPSKPDLPLPTDGDEKVAGKVEIEITNVDPVESERVVKRRLRSKTNSSIGDINKLKKNRWKN